MYSYPIDEERKTWHSNLGHRRAPVDIEATDQARSTMISFNVASIIKRYVPLKGVPGDRWQRASPLEEKN